MRFVMLPRRIIVFKIIVNRNIHLITNLNVVTNLANLSSYSSTTRIQLGEAVWPFL